MKKLSVFIYMSLLLCVSCAMNSCTSEFLDMDEGEQQTVKKTVKMRFNVRLNDFDEADGTTRATRGVTDGWKDGDTIYLVFTGVNGKKIPGSVKYVSSKSEWELKTLEGHPTVDLQSDDVGKVEAYYFDGNTKLGVDKKLLTYDNNVGIYSCLDGTYTYRSDEELYVNIPLKPHTSRIRFVGKPDTEFTVEGINTYTSFDTSKGEFTVSHSGSTRIKSDGSSDYIYCVFSDSINPQFAIENWTENQVYLTKYNSATPILTIGKSGYMNLPTMENYIGWTNEAQCHKTFVVESVKFEMKYVHAGTFQMGSPSVNGDGQLVHQVTLTNGYYMGETEITQALWEVVNGPNEKWTDELGLGKNYPAYEISYYDVQTFISKLNSKTLEDRLTCGTFRMPTEAEWEFAARGGNKSKGYTYSGSGHLGEVAWFQTNSSSKAHEVKGKDANELGLYDMSGNVLEWCLDWHNSYSSQPIENPTGPANGTYRIYRGGSWSSDAQACHTSYRDGTEPKYTTCKDGKLGFRLALSIR